MSGRRREEDSGVYGACRRGKRLGGRESYMGSLPRVAA